MNLQVLSAVFSPDGTRVLTKDIGRQSQLWNTTNGLAVGQPFQQTRGVTINSFSADSALVLAFLDSKLRVHNARTGRLVAEPLDAGHVVARARFIGSGQQLLTSTFGGEAQVWNMPALAVSQRRLDHRSEINAVALSPDGAMVAAGIRAAEASVWDIATGTSVASLAHEGQVLQVAFDLTGRRLVTASSDGAARVWAMPSGRLLGEPLRHGRAVFNTAFSPDGRWLITCAEDFTARLWDVNTLQAVSAPLRHGGDVRAAAFRPDGKIVATAGIDNMVRLWSVPEGSPFGEPLRHSNWVSAVAFSPDGNLLASSGSERVVRLWNLSKVTGSGVSNRVNASVRTFLRHEGHVLSVQFDAAGARVVTASDDRTARLWSVSTGEALARPLHHTDRVAWAGFSPDGRFVLTASNDGTARVWDSTTGHPVTDPLRHDDSVTSARWSPRGDFVATGSYDRTVRIWRLDFLSTEPIPEWLPDLAEAVGGKRLIGDHLHVPVPPKEFLRLRELLLNRLESEPGPQWLENFVSVAPTASSME